VLEKISQTHFSSRVRLAAATTLAGLEPVAARNDVWRSMLADMDSAVSEKAAKTLDS